MVNIYLSSSWKNRDRVRSLAVRLRGHGHEVYDFTDPLCRSTPKIPPEQFPEQFDPEKHIYGEYLTSVPEWREAINANRGALEMCDAVVLMLPCGLDAHADAYYAFGRGKMLIISGQPPAGERTPTHMWADRILPWDDDVVKFSRRNLGMEPYEYNTTMADAWLTARSREHNDNW